MDLGVGVAIFIDEMQDISGDELSALCAACHEISQAEPRWSSSWCWPPHLLVARRQSHAERLFDYRVVDRLLRAEADRHTILPRREDVGYDDDALEALYRLTDGYPYFVQAYGKVAWDAGRKASSISRADIDGRRLRRRRSWRSASSARAAIGHAR